MKSFPLTALLVLVMLSTSAFAQSDTQKSSSAKPDNPLSAYTKHVYDGVQKVVLRSAEKMPEENYSFEPAETVRSYGQILGHIADAQYLFCSVALGEKNPAPKIEQTKTSKADLIAALKDAFAYCNKAYDAMTDATASQTLSLFGKDAPRLGVLSVNTMHSV